MAGEIDPGLVADVLGFKRARTQDTLRRVAAAPFFAAAGATGQPLPTNLLPQYQSQQEFELRKLELKRDLIKSWHAAQAAGGGDESKVMKVQLDFASDVLDKFLTRDGVDQRVKAEIRGNFNNNVTKLATKKATDKLRLELSGAGANGTALRSAIDQYYVQTENGTNGGVQSNDNMLGILDRVVTGQRGWASRIGGTPTSQAGAVATMYRALAAADSIMRDSPPDPDKAHSLDELFAKNPDDPRIALLKQTWDAAKSSTSYSDIQALVEAENSAANQEALDQLYRDVPDEAKGAVQDAKEYAAYFGVSGKGPDDVTDAVDKVVGNTPTRGASGLSPNAQILNSWSAQQGLAPLVPAQREQGETTNYGLLKGALDEIDQMSPTLSPGSMKAQILQSPEFSQWMQQRGLNPAAPEVGWKALKAEVGDLHSKAAKENRAVLRSKAAGGATPPTTPPDSGNAATDPAPPTTEPKGDHGASNVAAVQDVEAPRGDGAPTFVVGPDGNPWYRSNDGAELRPATSTELDSLNADLEAGMQDALLPASAFARLKASTAMNAREARRRVVGEVQAPPGPPLRPIPAPTEPPASFIPALQKSFADRKREFQRQAMFGERPTEVLPPGPLASPNRDPNEYETSMTGPSTVAPPHLAVRATNPPSFDPGLPGGAGKPAPNLDDATRKALLAAIAKDDQEEIARILGVKPLEASL